ncbi:MAG: hypothetical protein DRN17_05350 [Thermoplasmata archaeon]|nr:MAG: hypothetical protein DRN17_05350 [Thermoplasmata archaeon]
MSNAQNLQDIEEAMSGIQELLDEGFYPEEYLGFTGKIEAFMSTIDTLTTAQWREVIDLKNANTSLQKTIDSSGVLTLYPEDFHRDHDWNAVCEQMDVEPDVTSMTITTLGVESIRDDEGEDDVCESD